MNYESKVWQKPLVPTTKKSRSYSEAKRAMRDLGIRRALLAVNSLRTSNILDIITVELD